MDKETIELIEGVRKSLYDFGKTQTGSALKKTRKITSQIIWSAEEYIDELDNIKSSSKTDEEAIQRIRSLVRSSEEAALKSMTVLPDDTGHHLVQSRTGGDALTELSYQRTGPIIQRLSEKHQRTFGNTMGPTGNLPPEMSLSNFAHKADDRATGLERESGIGKNPNKATVAHQKGTAAYANMKGVDLASDEAIFADLDVKVGEQIEAGRVAAQTDAPRQEFIRQMSGIPELYKGPVPKGLQLDPAMVIESYRKLRPGLQNAAKVLGMVGGPLAVLGAISDVQAAQEGASTIKKASTPRQRVKGALQATSGASGLASLTPVAPAAAPLSLVTGGAAAVMDFFDQRRQQRQRDIELQTGLQSSSTPMDAQIVPTQSRKPRTRYRSGVK